MHYRNFTFYDGATIVGISLIIYVVLQLLLARNGKPTWQFSWVGIALLIGVAASLLSSLFYREQLGANAIAERGPLVRAGYPRWIYETGDAPGQGLFNEAFRFQWQYFLENTLIYGSVILVLICLVRLVR